ncbi:hypothetical protein EBO34_06005 [Alteribacter keqinensis]|uniref:Uncharacterized protein n=1 Tax=Alteribacter keqinensis TaxID=2483800 RepID=A0A3M7TV96_9BACI|nr:hypothetical protein EBO34_06005 [Alteribacter keqinensis]
MVYCVIIVYGCEEIKFHAFGTSFIKDLNEYTLTSVHKAPLNAIHSLSTAVPASLPGHCPAGVSPGPHCRWSLVPGVQLRLTKKEPALLI